MKREVNASSFHGVATGKRMRMQGQALTEFLVVVIALVPLFLLIPLIAKYQDIAHATQVASRYVAFSAMTRNSAVSTWTPVEQLANDVRRRFFSNPDAAIKAHDVPENINGNQNPFWRGPTDQALIENINEDVRVSFGFDQESDHESAFSSTNDNFKMMSDSDPQVKIGQELGLQARGIYTANVSVRLLNLPENLRFYQPFDNIDLSISRSTSLVIDPWTARDPEQVESKIASSGQTFPAGNLAGISSQVGSVVTGVEMGRISPPKLGRLDFWRDVVPGDRLKRGN